MQVDFNAAETLVEPIAALLREEFEDAAALPTAELEAFVRPQVRKAALYGLSEVSDVSVYALCAWLTGDAFDTEFDAPKDILAGKASAADKAAALEAWLDALLEEDDGEP